MDESRPWVDRWAGVALMLLVFYASLSAIRSYDYFWHLATGRWIIENRTLPATDPFALASDAGPWINGEWLFQTAQYEGFAHVGHAGLIVLKALAIALVFGWLLLFARRFTTIGPAVTLILIAVAGSLHRLDVRPETAGVLLLPFAVALMRRPTGPGNLLLLGVVTATWINLHPSALLVPVLVSLFSVGDIVGAVLARERPEWRGPAARLAVTGGALLANPHGWEGILAPARLAAFLRRSGVVNLEWTMSRPVDFPLLYVVLLAGGLLLVVGGVRSRRLGELIVFLFLGALAIRYVRNHAFFFVVMPMLVAPALSDRIPSKIEALTPWVAAVVALLVMGQSPIPELGPEAGRFPARAVEQLHEAGLEGNIYNPDQFGGYLIWSFYPERRVLTDGRNELYHRYLAEYDRARLDSREWSSLLERYDISLAVDEYRPEPMQVLDAVSGQRRWLPASQVYFPRDGWALIAFDDAAMVFARRDRFPAAVLSAIEYRSLVPDATSFETAFVGGREEVQREISRAMSEVGRSARVARLLQFLQSAGRGAKEPETKGVS